MSRPRLASESSVEHPNKKVKRSHTPTKFDRTPPPSPGLQNSIEGNDTESTESTKTKTIDLEGINDEIVHAVIVRLQETGNRPQLVKELSAVLIDQLKIVQQYVSPVQQHCLLVCTLT